MTEIRVGTVSDAAGTGPAVLTGQWAAKARFSYNQTTPAVNDSENVSSITDLATGHEGVNFTNNLADGNYSVAGASCQSLTDTTASWRRAMSINVLTASQAKMMTFDTDGTAGLQDDPLSTAAFHGDLA